MDDSNYVEQYLLLSQGVFVYATLFFMLLGGAVGLPIPEDVPLVLAGIAIHSGRAQTGYMFLACYSAIIIGDAIVFLIGRRFGPTLFGREWFKKRISANSMRQIRVSLERRSLLMIFIARHLFYLRTVTFLTCGAVKMRISRFMLADALAALVSVPIMMSLGYYAAEQANDILKNARNISIMIGVLLLIVVVLLYLRRKNKIARIADEKDLAHSAPANDLSAPKEPEEPTDDHPLGSDL